jgi:hypothetical protein
MTRNSRIVEVIKGHLSTFSGIISKDLPKPKQRLVREMIYGIQASKDIKHSYVTRALNEPIPLIKTEDRFSRNLDDRDSTEPIRRQIRRLMVLRGTHLLQLRHRRWALQPPLSR